MTKSQRKSLAAALQAESTRAPQTATQASMTETSGGEVEEKAAKIEKPLTQNISYVPPSRRGKKVVSGYFDTEVSKQLKILCIEHDTSLQALLAEAINDLFIKHGKSPIA